MDVALNPKSFAKFADAPILANNYYVSTASTKKRRSTSSAQNYGKAFNTLGVTSPVRIPKPLSNDRATRNLQIFEHKEGFLKAVAEWQVVLVVAEHRSERSTQLPQFVLENACERELRCRIICTQPRQLSTFYSSARVAEERGEYLGGAVGSQIKLKFQYGLTSGLIYCTNDIVLNTLMHHNKDYLHNITHIMIDDVQEHDPCCDLLLVFLREHLKTNANLKVILTTTKGNVGQFSSYFENSRVYSIEEIDSDVKRLYLEDVLEMFYDERFSNRRESDALFEKAMNDCLLLQKGRHFDVLLHLIYANDGYVNKQSRNGLTPLTVASLTGRYQLVRLLIRLGAKIDFDRDLSGDLRSNVSIDVPLITKIIIYAHKNKKGSTLVFLPSYEDLITTKESLLLSLPMDVNEYEIVVMYESMDPKSFQRALEICENQHKIILSTSATEGSVVIPNVAHIIDTGRAENGNSTVNTWISQEAAGRRAAKAAISIDGMCFHLYTKEFYETLQKEDGVKLLHAPLHGYCLRAKLLATPTGNINRFFQTVLNAPKQKTVNKAIRDLTILGALDSNAELTVLGTLLTQLSIEPRLGKVLVYSVIFKCLDPILTMVACLCYKNPIVLVHDAALCDVKPLSDFAGEFLSDHLVLLKIYQEWQKLKISKKDVSVEQQCVNWYAMEIVHEIRGELLSQLRGIGFVNLQIPGRTKELNENSDRWPIVKAVLTAGCYTNIYFVEARDKVTFHKSSALHVPSFPSDSPFCVIYEDHVEKKPPRSSIRFGTVVTSLTVALMYERARFRNLEESNAALHLGESNVKLFSDLLKEIIYKKIANPTHEFSKNELEIFNVARDALCVEEIECKLPQPHGVGAMPRLFLNVRAKSTQQQLYELYGKHGFSLDQNANPAPRLDNDECVYNFNRSQRTVFFIVKPTNYEDFYRSLTTSGWIFGSKSEKKLFVYLNQKNVVKLFFSVSKSDHFQGVAELVTDNGRNSKNACRLCWISIKNVPFELIRMNNLKNICDDNKLVSEGKDGQEIEYDTGLQLLNMFL